MTVSPKEIKEVHSMVLSVQWPGRAVKTPGSPSNGDWLTVTRFFCRARQGARPRAQRYDAAHR
eukprot:139076-Amphidinium_carterae.2